jgi:predicted lipid-binding transport protein (Tim44 family)
MRRDAAPTQNTTAPTQAAKPAPGATPVPAPQPSGMSRWMGPLAGLAAGLGIAALLSHFGLGEGAANIVMIMLLVMAAIFVLRMIFARKQTPNHSQYANAGNAQHAPNAAEFRATETTGSSANATMDTAVPESFDTASLLRQAKITFVRLQAANDRGDMADIRNFTAPELFAEVQMQYEERGRSRQQTDVVQLDAELLDVSLEGDREIASVRFEGRIREVANTAPEDFNEVWHLTRPRDGAAGWIVAGIQQAEG